ncbi:uncharacterized protein PAC_09097 [Phialocephala subalpina]|uniref:Uncharacterized protein n=1 Tax=Phialocephala subalpina TaxID=576137 RepID=A0A1L7X2G2_9HELO|nr:uncharacterized protein PAC_09097 [Phialocephala subalpina]
MSSSELSHDSTMDVSIMGMASSTTSISTSATTETTGTTATTARMATDTIKAQDSRLLRLPEEIKQKIFTLVVTVDGPVTPMQLRAKSNKFIWSKDQYVKDGATGGYKIDVSAVKPLDVVALTAVCKKVYQEVSLTHLFYKSNEFEFRLDNLRRGWNESALLEYLVAITGPRRQEISSITYDWHLRYRHEACEHVFTMLSQCSGLKALNLHVKSYVLSSASNVNNLRGLPELKHAVKGLSAISVVYDKPPKSSYPWENESEEVSETNRKKTEQLKSILEKARAGPKASLSDNLAKVNSAMLHASLDIHGEGRLSEDKKPGVIASRTRQRVKANATIQPDGTFLKREPPKYDMDGTLSWAIKSISASREIVTDFGDAGVEFKLVCWKSPRRYGTSDEAEFWADITVLDPNEFGAAEAIADFYGDGKNVDAFGLEVAIESWKQRPVEDRRSYEYSMDRLQSALKARDKKLREAEEKARKAAAKEAKAAKKGKTVVKSKNAAGKKRA